jgi:hypothetical protein
MQGGQGDVLMAANGLQALIELGLPVLAANAVCYTRSFIVPLVRVMLPELTVTSLDESRHAAHPRYATSAKTSWTTVIRNCFTSDWYVNFAERRRMASHGYVLPSRFSRLRQRITDWKLASGSRWLRETPSYYGLKMWAPLAEAWSVSEIALLRGLYASYRTMAHRLRSYARSLQSAPAIPLAIFPGGRSFQFIPAGFMRGIIHAIGQSRDGYCCCFAPEDPLLNEYRAANLTCEVTRSVEEMLAVMVHSTVTVTADSLASHIAQLTANAHLALMSHDLPQHTVHPAASSVVVYEPLNCCPCVYGNRTQGSRCPAGHAVCAVFGSSRYFEATVHAVQRALSA